MRACDKIIQKSGTVGIGSCTVTASVHTALSVQQFLAKKKMSHHSYSHLVTFFVAMDEAGFEMEAFC